MRQARGGDIADRCAAKSDHTSREAVDVQLTTLVRVESGLDMCRSAGFQTEAVISIIRRVTISQSVGTCDSKRRFGPDASSGMNVLSGSIPSGRWGSHGSLQTLYPWERIWCGLMSKQCRSLPNHRTWSATRTTELPLEEYVYIVAHFASNWNVCFRLVVCGEWGDGTVRTGELKEPPIRPGTDCVCAVIDFIETAVSGMGWGNLRALCASATRTRYDGMCHPSTAGLLVSVVAIGTATETMTVLRATFCYLGNDRVVAGRDVLVSRTTIHRDHAVIVLLSRKRQSCRWSWRSR